MSTLSEAVSVRVTLQEVPEPVPALLALPLQGLRYEQADGVETGVHVHGLARDAAAQLAGQQGESEPADLLLRDVAPQHRHIARGGVKIAETADGARGYGAHRAGTDGVHAD